MPYNLCIFDLDGTLTDPKEEIIKSYQYALSAFGVDFDPGQIAKFIGPPLRDIFRDLYNLPEPDVEKAVAKFRECFAQIGLTETFVFPEIPETLQKLKDSGRVLAVATSKYHVFAGATLKHFDLEKYFSFVSGDEPDGRLSKNGKFDIIRIALDTLDPVRKMSAVMIGDRMYDIEGAAENGIDSIAVTWGYGSQAEFSDAGATWVAHSPDELCRLIL